MLTLALLGSQLATPAFAAPSGPQNPREECGGDVLYNKFQINNGEVGGLESNTDPEQVIELTATGLVVGGLGFDYENLYPDDFEIFRIVLKSGQTPNVVLDDPIQIGSLVAPLDISHITFCLREPTTPPPPPPPSVVDVQVALGACTTDGTTSSTPAIVTITGEGAASVVISQGETVIETFTSSGTVDLAPGTYSFAVTPDEGSVLSEGSDTGGTLEVVDCTPPPPPPPSIVNVKVELGLCVAEGETSSTPAIVTITGAGTATVAILQGDSVIETFTSSGSVDLAPGTYSFTVTPGEDSELSEGSDTGGTLEVLDCSEPPPPPPPADLVDVQVALGACTTDGTTSSTPAIVTITGEGAASVVISQGETVIETFTSSGTVDLAPGTYSFAVTPAEGSELTEGSDTAGDLTVLDCTIVVEPAGSVDVAIGTCVFEDPTSSTAVTVEIAPAGAATLLLTGEDFSHTFSGAGGTIEVEPGDYSWEATRAPDFFNLEGDVAGSFTAEECSEVKGERLPETGADASGIARTGVMFLLAGMLLLVLARVGRPSVAVATLGGGPIAELLAWAGSRELRIRRVAPDPKRPRAGPA